MSDGRFWLTVVCVNWGRDYKPGVFRSNVLTVLRAVEDAEHVVILPQEVDEEPDPAHEHRELESLLAPGTKKVYWPTREPIILSPGFTVVDRWRRRTMGSGLEIGGPPKTGPARYAVTCVVELEGIRLGFGNTHPHRNMPTSPRVQAAREKGQGIFADALLDVYDFDGGTSTIWGADLNDLHVPKLLPREKVAHHQGVDHLRYAVHPDGARIELKEHDALVGTIDDHDPIWARFLVEAA